VRVVLGDGGPGGSAGGASGGGGGAAGSGIDAGGTSGGAGGTGGGASGATGGSFTPAAHPDLPQVGTLGGPVLLAPKVRPIIYSNDTSAADIQAFVEELARTTYWSAVTSEYGVGALTVLPPIMMPFAAPGSTTDAALQTVLAANTTGADSAWGPPDPSTVYLFVIPEGSTVTIDQSTCCDDFGGYHSEAMSGAVSVPYAVGCSCPGFFGSTVRPLDERTIAISHELVETATDPFPVSNPAYQIEDRADIIWTVVNGGGEVGDMCAFNDDAAFVPPGAKYMVQRSWSNAAAKKMQNPCVPYATTAPYFNSFPALESVALGADKYLTRGVQVGIGKSRTIDVNLYSSAPTAGTWTVSAYDYDYWFRGLPAKLALSLDKAEGRNGDTLHLTITAKAQDPDLGAEAFILVSHYGAVRDPDYQTNLTLSLVSN
jgi:hypothetical protein